MQVTVSFLRILLLWILLQNTHSAERILHHMQTGVLKYLKVHLRKTLNLPLTLQTVP